MASNPYVEPQRPETLHWVHSAACAGQPELFFQPLKPHPTKDKIRERAAKVVCNSCPVIEECRRQAIRNRERSGVWGGLSEATLESAAKNTVKHFRALQAARASQQTKASS